MRAWQGRVRRYSRQRHAAAAAGVPPHLCLRVHLQHPQLRRDHGGQGGAVHVCVKDAHLHGQETEGQGGLQPSRLGGWVAGGGALLCRMTPAADVAAPWAAPCTGPASWALRLLLQAQAAPALRQADPSSRVLPHTPGHFHNLCQAERMRHTLLTAARPPWPPSVPG